jgi:glyoxylase-like metal-dependent hydrolase (beta-lactamase superfamily II)
MLEQFWLFHCGWIRLPRPAFVAGARLDFPRLPFLAGLAVHPEHGPILFDAPFGRAGFGNLGKFIGALARTAGMKFEEEWSVSARIQQLGFRPEEVEHVCMTHLHYDHTGGLPDVPNASIHVCRAEWEYTRSLDGIAAFKAGIKPENLDDRDDVELFEMPPHLDADPTGADIFGDGSIRAVGLPGHSAGHVGYRLRFDDASLLFAGDAAFSAKQYESRRSLGYFPRQIAYDRTELKRSLRALRTFHAENPDVRIVVSHDFELGEACLDGPTRLYDPSR